MNKVKLFNEFLEEGYNFITTDIGDIEFEDRWFYYEPEDEIIYGCDDEPVNEINLFYFNPKSCTVVVDDKIYQYDINNPICLIVYEYKNDEVKFYEDFNVLDFLKEMGYDLDENYESHKTVIQNMFDNNDNYKFLLMYGNKLIATTFDIIEEN